ncbi:alpha/beta fold hydrolase [Alteromonas sp. H39]|uniref:alpha/beta fold hydrolase n=1 Tax=Alteromonas sp. H39 TaxID=3389876 RepID=UPI0039DFA35C
MKKLHLYLAYIFTVLTPLMSFSLSAQVTSKQSVIRVQVHGNGEPVILIPGLMSDGSVWKSTTEALSTTYQVHIVNVAGFGITPKAQGTTAESIEQAIVDYIQQQKLASPVVIGHSFGGFLALALAVNPAVDIKKVISVDGLPFIGPLFTRNNDTTAEHLRPQAEQLLAMYSQLSHDQLVSQTRMGIAIQATSEKAQQQVLDYARQSDPATVGQITHDIMTRDLRSSLADNPTPILLLGASGAFNNRSEHDYAASLYQAQLAKAPHAKVIMNTQSRHFIMLDDPAWLNKHITAFLGE